MAIDHTAGVPPSVGRTIFAKIGRIGKEREITDDREEQQGAQKQACPERHQEACPGARDLVRLFFHHFRVSRHPVNLYRFPRHASEETLMIV